MVIDVHPLKVKEGVHDVDWELRSETAILAGIDSESVTLRCLASVFLYTVKSLFLFRCHAHQYQYYQYKNLIH